LTDRSTLEIALGAPTIRPIDVLILCTANQCRSPMAEVLLRRHLERAGVDATVSSAGLYEGGAPATDHGVAAMADRGLDLSRHRSRRLSDDMVREADLVIAMTRLHAREAAVLVPDTLRKTFTLKELAREAAIAGERGRDEPFDVWLGRVAEHRTPGALLGVGHNDELDVADPIGGSRADYEVTADLLDRLLGEVVDLAFPLVAEERSA
jgi:protein-tyrosine-phosphatase